MGIDTKTDEELIQLWEELTARMNSDVTAAGATQELRVLSQIHLELAKRGYKPSNGIWVKAVVEEKQ